MIDITHLKAYQTIASPAYKDSVFCIGRTKSGLNSNYDAYE